MGIAVAFTLLDCEYWFTVASLLVPANDVLVNVDSSDGHPALETFPGKCQGDYLGIIPEILGGSHNSLFSGTPRGLGSGEGGLCVRDGIFGIFGDDKGSC